jgi:uncharacterized caspase-like protein
MKRLTAIVIGNADYEDASTLKNPVNDAEDVAKKLEDGGFVVIKLTDASCKERGDVQARAQHAQR